MSLSQTISRAELLLNQFSQLVFDLKRTASSSEPDINTQALLKEISLTEEYCRWWESKGQFIGNGSADESKFAFEVFSYFSAELLTLRKQLSKQHSDKTSSYYWTEAEQEKGMPLKEGALAICALDGLLVQIVKISANGSICIEYEDADMAVLPNANDILPLPNDSTQG